MLLVYTSLTHCLAYTTNRRVHLFMSGNPSNPRSAPPDTAASNHPVLHSQPVALARLSLLSVSASFSLSCFVSSIKTGTLDAASLSCSIRLFAASMSVSFLGGSGLGSGFLGGGGFSRK